MVKSVTDPDIILVTAAPFSAIHLNQIFQESPKQGDRLISRENGWLGHFRQDAPHCEALQTSIKSPREPY